MSPQTKDNLIKWVGIALTVIAMMYGTITAFNRHGSDIEQLKNANTVQWRKISEQEQSIRSTDKKLDEIGFNLKQLMNSQGLQYTKTDE